MVVLTQCSIQLQCTSVYLYSLTFNESPVDVRLSIVTTEIAGQLMMLFSRVRWTLVAVHLVVPRLAVFLATYYGSLPSSREVGIDLGAEYPTAQNLGACTELTVQLTSRNEFALLKGTLK